uniref:Uncharacterized protein n=1 Tax=Trichuris muris TaxID=70415 RepID=A0A5S6QSS3_TRIMR
MYIPSRKMLAEISKALINAPWKAPVVLKLILKAANAASTKWAPRLGELRLLSLSLCDAGQDLPFHEKRPQQKDCLFSADGEPTNWKLWKSSCLNGSNVAFEKRRSAYPSSHLYANYRRPLSVHFGDALAY